MGSRRQELAAVRISDEEYARLEGKLEALKNEYQICRRKLDSKHEALLILSQELDQCRSERDQFKLMAEQLRERYQAMKQQQSGQVGFSASDDYRHYSEMQSQSLAKLLCDSREQNKSLEFEMEDLKQKLHDAQGDIKLLREQIARQRVGTTDEGMNTRHFPAHEREDLVQQLEASREQYLQIERDLQQVLDEKEELVTERDVYKTKYERLNQELNYILKGDEKRVVDIDALVMENKYLQERMKQMEEEKTMAIAAVTKYKSLLERKKKGCLKFGQSRGGGMVITQKQVQEVLDNKSGMLATPQAMADLQALAGALLDTVNDKNLALSHQRKTNKILGNRVSELEKKIKTLEVAGLWNIPSSVSASLEKLRAECEEVKMLTPSQMSQSSDNLTSPEPVSETGTPTTSNPTSPEHSPEHVLRTSLENSLETGGHPSLSHFNETLEIGISSGVNPLALEDLDLLPTKEVSSKPTMQELGGGDATFKSAFLCSAVDDDAIESHDGAFKTDNNIMESGKGKYTDSSEHVLREYHDDHSDIVLREYHDEDEHDEEDLDDSLNVTNNDADSGDQDDITEDDETTEKIRLLMENATQKMKRFSHGSDDGVSSDAGTRKRNYSAGEEDIVIESGHGEPQESESSSSCQQPLLTDLHDHNSESNVDDVGNVEC